ncbi:MAG: UPF0175 family protein [Nanoarchaeota archaeon]|mgnify:CR=1
MTLISTRIPEDIEKDLKWYAQKERIGISMAMRKVLDKGLQDIKIEYALELYKKGRVSLWKAAEIAGISLWEIIDIVKERKIPRQYTQEDTEKDIKATLKE